MEEFLKGKKTYIVGIAWVVVAIWQDLGDFDYETAFSALEGAALMTVRAALAKIK